MPRDFRQATFATSLVVEAMKRHGSVRAPALLELMAHRGAPNTVELRRAWNDPAMREALGYLLATAHQLGVSPAAALELGLSELAARKAGKAVR